MIRFWVLFVFGVWIIPRTLENFRYLWQKNSDFSLAKREAHVWKSFSKRIIYHLGIITTILAGIHYFDLDRNIFEIPKPSLLFLAIPTGILNLFSFKIILPIIHFLERRFPKEMDFNQRQSRYNLSRISASKGFFKAVLEGLSFGAQYFVITSLLIAFPILAVVVVSFLKALAPVFIRFNPEIVLAVIVLGVFVSMIVDLFVTSSTTLLYLKARNENL